MSYAISITGLNNANTDLNVISNNIANSETDGFKQSAVSFANLVATSSNTNPKQVVGMGARVAEIGQDFAQGTITQTGKTLDMAVSGDGFLTVKSPTTLLTSYTRNGAFSLDASGYIVNPTGERLQIFPAGSTGTTTLGDAQVPKTNSAGAAYAGIAIANDGTITVSYTDGSSKAIGQVTLSTFADNQGLLQQGDGQWTATGLSGQATYGQPTFGTLGKIMSGALEQSNVDISSALVQLVTAQRDFQANAKAIDANTQMSNAIINLQH